MFKKSLPEDHGLLLVQNTDSKINASIHMMFMRIDLAIIWINSEYSVVDVVLARRWRMAYFPKTPAKYVLETGVSHILEFKIGDKVLFDNMLPD